MCHYQNRDIALTPKFTSVIQVRWLLDDERLIVVHAARILSVAI